VRYECNPAAGTKLIVEVDDSGISCVKSLPNGRTERKNFGFPNVNRVVLYKSDVTFVCQIQGARKERISIPAASWDQGWQPQHEAYLRMIDCLHEKARDYPQIHFYAGHRGLAVFLFCAGLVLALFLLTVGYTILADNSGATNIWWVEFGLVTLIALSLLARLFSGAKRQSVRYDPADPPCDYLPRVHGSGR